MKITERGDNLLGQLIKKTGDNSYPVAFTYDADGKTLSLTDGNGAVTSWIYNEFGQLEKKLYDGSLEASRPIQKLKSKN